MEHVHPALRRFCALFYGLGASVDPHRRKQADNLSRHQTHHNRLRPVFLRLQDKHAGNAAGNAARIGPWCISGFPTMRH